MNPARRVRVHAGHFALIGVLALVAALLITGAPRFANRLADEGLREQLAAEPAAVRDLVYQEKPPPGEPPMGGATRPELLDRRQESMEPVLRQAIGERWYTAETTQARATAGYDKPGPPVDLVLRAVTGGQRAVTMVEGRWPAGGEVPSGPSAAPEVPIEVALARPVAEDLDLHVGSLLTTRPAAGIPAVRQVTVVGIFTPADPAGGIWDTDLPALRVVPPPPEAPAGTPAVAVALTSGTMLAVAQDAQWDVTYTWRYRVAPDRLNADQVQPLIDAVRHLDLRNEPGVRLTKGIDIPLLDFLETVTTARAVLAVVAAAVLATLAGLIVLAARLAARRRSAEYALVRARGGARRTLAGRGLAESLLVIPVAVLAGVLAGLAVPGRPGSVGWLLAGVAVLTVLALPVASVVATPDVGRRDLIRLSASARRLTAEVSLLALAAVGVVLLRRRGLPADGSVDPLLVSVPVLVAIGAAVLALRVYPWPVRLVSRLAARARGTVPFLGLARAGRAAVTGPLIVVVVGVAAAAFCAAVAAGIDDGRDRAAGLAVPAGAVLSGELFAPDTAEALAALPGTRVVVPVVAQSAQELLRPGAGAGRSGIDPAYVLVIDGPELARAAAAAGVPVELPDGLTTATAATGPVPAVVSPAVAADLAAGGMVTAQGHRIEFRVGGVADGVPLVPRNVDRFVVLPRQALTAEQRAALLPTSFLLAGRTLDPVAIQRVGDEGQRRYATTGSVTGAPPSRPSVVSTQADVRDRLASGGANGMLYFGFTAGVFGGALLGLLAIAFAVLAGARERGRVLSRLRTMGLSRPQWRGLLVLELGPLVGAAVLTGAVAGVLLPLLLTPALGLSAFTDGLPVRVRFDAGLAGSVVALGALALGVAITVEALINRRLRLGQVLRLGEES